MSCSFKLSVLLMMGFIFFTGCKTTKLNIEGNLKYCTAKATQTLSHIPQDTFNFPRSIPAGSDKWRYSDYREWTCGFWPGILWYAYQASGDSLFKIAADRSMVNLYPLAYSKPYSHDLGFKMYCSYGNGYRLTYNEQYKKLLIATADSLSTLYNPKVGTILSWPVEVSNYGAHNTIIDNMMNLELLFWAAKNGAGHNLYDIAVKHAITTMNNHFRKDYSCFHVVLYDTVSGKKIKGITHQGLNDSSMWARGQSWAIYGFTMCYRETGNPQFLDIAQKAADVYLKNLPESLIPNWDFNAPSNAQKDASAACVTASALIELSGYLANKEKAAVYLQKAEKMLATLSTKKYQSRNKNSAFLIHSTGNKPSNSEIDAAIIYADYYYLEALLRLKNIKQSKN